MTLRAITVLVLSAVLLAVVAGCGSKNASSPSGVELAYSVSEANVKDRGIFLIDREGKHRRRLLKRVQIPDAQDVHWSPTSDLILFDSLFSDEIWTIRSDGTDLTKIADGGGASWSPDGTMIAVTRGPVAEILSANGELQKRISTGVQGGASSSTPSWSPDGTNVAFATSSAKGSAIFVARLTGEGSAVALVKATNKAYPTSGQQTEYDTPYWSPDGELLAFISTKFDSPSIWTMRPDGSQRKRLASHAHLLGWAADGRGVLCTGELPDLRSPHECPLDGGSWRPLGPGEEKRADERDRYSPDGKQLVTATDSGSIVVSRPDGSARRVLTDAGTDNFPTWSPDGTHLAFVREAADDPSSAWVYLVGMDGKGARRLVRGEPVAWLPEASELLLRRMGAIVVVTLEGETRRLAEGLDPYQLADPALSRDGAMVAFLGAARDGYSKRTLYETDTRGGRERKVLDVLDAEADDLAWSSDGRKLYAVWTSGGGYPDDVAYATLHEITLSGSSRVVANGVNPDSSIAVSPSGDRVAFAGIHGLKVVDLETGKRRSVVAGKPDSFVDPQWSPDGSTLAYLANECPDCIPTVLETVRADGSARMQVSAPAEVVDSFSWRPASASD